jgi:hypothetical protein
VTALRAIIFVTLSLCIISLTLPAQAELSAHHAAKCWCCTHDSDIADKIDNHCKEPVQSQDRQCCVACPLGLALIASTAQKFVFPKRHGHRFGDGDSFEPSRPHRPPVPPPRA